MAANPMSARKATLTVLREAKQPLHVDEITKRILSQGLWQTSGKTPAATIGARLYTDIKTNGADSDFVQTSGQVFGLRELGHTAAPRAGSTPRQRPARKALSFSEATIKVLEVHGRKRPMHYREITKKAIQDGWLETEGKTPEASLYAQVLTEIKRYKARGEQPRFVKHGKGYVGLSQWMGRGLAFEIEQHNKGVRESLHKQLLEIDPFEFEELVSRLLAEIGFEEIEVTARGGDGGIDVRGTLVVGDVIKTRMAVQAKRWKPRNRVQAPVVQQVRGSLGAHEQGLIITTSDFSEGARREAARPDAVPVALMNGEQLVSLLVEHSIGVTKRAHDLLELGEGGESER